MFGSLAMAMIPDEKRKKFESKSRELMFIGYCENQKGYRLIDRKTDEIVTCRDVTVFERGNNLSNPDTINNNFEPIADDIDNQLSANESDSDDLDATITGESLNDSGVQHGSDNVANDSQANAINDTDTNNQTQVSVQHGHNNADDNRINDTANESGDFEDTMDDGTMYEPDETVDVNNDSDIWTLRRSERATKPPERFAPTMFAFIMYESMATNDEPATVRDALNSNESASWKLAMDDEYNSLLENQTWKLVDSPSGCKPINNKWVFKRKTDASGKTVRFKARLVAKGCSQREGIDFVETYSPVVRYSSIRLLIAMAVKYDLKIEQMDVVTAFLHGDVKETIYMKQPEAYSDGSNKVCLLIKSLYGLKQASRQWNIKLNEVLLRAGYKRCIKDACIYVRRSGDTMVIVAVYVDDLLIFHNHTAWKDQLKSTLTNNFKMKDLGQASNILGINIVIDRVNHSISLDQRKYTEAVLRRFKMHDCEPVKLPLDPNQRLTREMSPSNDDEANQMLSIPYQEAVGSILYLAQCTRPDISHSIAIVSQFNQIRVLLIGKASSVYYAI